MRLQFQDLDGRTIEEKEIRLSENDTLVMTFDHQEMSLDVAHEVFEALFQGLAEDRGLIGIPSSVELSVIKKTE